MKDKREELAHILYVELNTGCDPSSTIPFSKEVCKEIAILILAREKRIKSRIDKALRVLEIMDCHCVKDSGYTCRRCKVIEVIEGVFP
jgi:hypothetical protein